MSQWYWLTREAVIAMHEDQLAEHGGGVGLRAQDLLDTALAKPLQLVAYGDPPPDAAALAATYAYGLARLHPFIDGNKRTSLVAAESFLALQGFDLDATDEECVRIWLQIATGELDEPAIAEWLRARLQPMQD